MIMHSLHVLVLSTRVQLDIGTAFARDGNTKTNAIHLDATLCRFSNARALMNKFGTGQIQLSIENILHSGS